MGLFSMLFPKTAVNQATSGYFETLTAYQPRFTSFRTGIYEAELCRSAIHTFAAQCSKLDLTTEMKSKQKLLLKPNPFQTTSQFLYKLATTLECENTAFIFPMLDRLGDRIIGLYAINPSSAEVVEYKGVPWVKAKFPTGKTGLVELSRVGILTKFQYQDDFFGTKGNVLKPTLDLMDIQNRAIEEGVKNGASLRFMAKIAQTLKPSDIEAERQRFVNTNLSKTNETGVMMFDAKYSDVKQIESKPFVLDDKQMELINENVYTFFNTNRKILESSFNEDEWNAYYENKVEPFAIQLSQVLSAMLYDQLGNDMVIASANRLQYASTTTKLNVVTQLTDRGMLTPNEGREIFQMPGFGEEGDKRYIRLEYVEIDKLNETQQLTEGDTNVE